MAKAKITITGEIENFKVNEDDTVSIIIKADTSENVPTGLKVLGSTTYKVSISKKMWEKVSIRLSGNKILITGEPKAAVTAKGVPFNLVNCFDISVIEKKVKVKESEPESKPKKAVLPKPVQSQKNEVQQEIKPLDTKTNSSETKNSNIDLDGKAIYHWRKNHKDIQDVKVADLVLTEEKHLNGFNTAGYMSFNYVKNKALKKPIIVRPLDNGKFSLVVGFMPYIIAKVLNFETLSAIITDFSRQEIIEEALKQIKMMENEVAASLETVKIT